MFRDAPPFLEASTTSSTCIDLGLVNNLVNSGIRAAPNVPALIITERLIHRLFGKSLIVR